MRYRCQGEKRRAMVLAHPSLNGIDDLEVLDREAPEGAPPRRTLLLRMLKALPPGGLGPQARAVILAGAGLERVRVSWALTVARLLEQGAAAGIGRAEREFYANLSGADGTPTALVGSTDGFLYAVDACTGALRWSHRFDAPVGAPILSDTDGDGLDDIVVSVADGYLYGLRHEILPAPGFVWDVDVPRGLTAEDIDEIETESALYAAWAPVPGATTYELAVVGAAGTYLTAPAWVDVGAGTSATITGLPLEDGAKFYVGVRAVGPAGKGPDRPSDGVIVRLRPGADEPGRAGEYLLWGRGCACSLGGAGEGAVGLGAAVVLLSALGARRRSRRRRGPAMPGLDPRSTP